MVYVSFISMLIFSTISTLIIHEGYVSHNIVTIGIGGFQAGLALAMAAVFCASLIKGNF